MATTTYEIRRRENAHFASMINAAWGSGVAWVEDRTFPAANGGQTILPIVVSKMVGGLVPGLTPPPFKRRIGA